MCCTIHVSCISPFKNRTVLCCTKSSESAATRPFALEKRIANHAEQRPQDRSALEKQNRQTSEGLRSSCPATAGVRVRRARQARRAERTGRRASSLLEDARRPGLSRRRTPTDAPAGFVVAPQAPPETPASVGSRVPRDSGRAGARPSRCGHDGAWPSRSRTAGRHPARPQPLNLLNP